MEILVVLFSIPILAAVLCAFSPGRSSCTIVSSFLMWLQLLACIWLFVPLLTGVETIWHLIPGILVDRISAIFILLTSLITACALTYAIKFFQNDQSKEASSQGSHVRVFLVFSMLFYVAMLAVFLCDNLGFLWISIETTTLMSAALVYFNRDKHAVEATWKYLIICSVGIAFALLGTVCFFISSKYGINHNGTLNISDLIRLSPDLEPIYRRLGFIFCFLGYGTKAGIFPLHSWLPDAHSEAPAPASAMLSGSLLNCALFAIFKLSLIGHASIDGHFSQDLLIWSGTLTVFAASIFLVRQHGIKRLWAYSSIENVGLMIIAIGFNAPSIFILQAINHSLAKTALFLISGDIIIHSGSKELNHIKGLWHSMPIRASIFASAAIAITGAPPFGAFISEMMLLSSGADASRWTVVTIIVFSLAIAFIMICFHTGRILVGVSNRLVEYDWRSSLIPGTLVIFTLVLGITTGPYLIGSIK